MRLLKHSPRTVTVLGLLVVLAAPAAAQSISVVGQRVACQGGSAAGFGCAEADLMSVLTPIDIGASHTCSSGNRLCNTNDLWGWTDSATGREFALVGREDGMAFVEVTDPLNPAYLGQLPHNGTRPSSWRDVKTYAHYAYVVADGAGGLGMQVFDLTELYSFDGTPLDFAPVTVYEGFDSAHNVAINEESGFAYVVGARGGTSCAGGFHMVSLADPVAPTFAGCFTYGQTGRAGNGYTHDAQCVIYRGPDTVYQGREICFGANETHVVIGDVTDKGAPVAVAKADYPDVFYAHQGWLTEDHRFFIQNDELDEAQSPTVSHTRTMIWDVIDLDDPVLLKEYLAPGTSTDHNLYVKGQFVYQSNYTDGLRILDISDIMNPVEVSFFDTHPVNMTRFDGTWSNYPFFESGAIGVTSSVDGFFMILPTGVAAPVDVDELELPDNHVLAETYPNPFRDRLTVTISVPASQSVRIVLFDALGREVRTLYRGVISAGDAHRIDAELGDLPVGQYFCRITGETFEEARAVTRVR